MKVFLSYRRDDTGGRAGRLADALVRRFGEHDVFHDVVAVAPGADFPTQVDAAVRSSDVVLVVIGPRWLDAPAPGGGRRIDDPDDFVRREVAAALDAGVRVVPVLVDGAALPAAHQLPDEVRPLLHRNAVELRDVSWHQDVEDLLRGLAGERRRTTPPRTLLAAVGVGAVALAALVVVVVAVVNRDDDGGDDGADPTDAADELTDCPQLDEPEMTTGDLADDRSTTWSDGGRTADVSVTQLSWREIEGGVPEVFVELLVANGAPAGQPAADAVDASVALIDGILVDGIAQRMVWCESRIGDASVEPGQSALFRFGVEVEVDPSSAAIVVELSDDGQVDAGRFRV